MQKIVYKLYDNNHYSSVSQFIPYPKSQMHLLYLSFFPQYDWINLDIQNDQIIIWDSFDEKYEAWDKISKLYLLTKNYDEIIERWNQNLKNPAPYLILSRDNTAWVTLETKNILSIEDLESIEEDKKAGQEWKEKKKL